MDFTPLVVLQERLNDLETNYGAQNRNDANVLSPRVARVAPMPTGSDNVRLPSISYQASATFDISALQLPNPTETTFSNAAAAVAAAAPVTAAAGAAEPALHVASNSASYSTSPSNTTTYASSPIRYTAPQPSLYCVATTSRNMYHGSGSAYNSDTDSATDSAASTETVTVSDHDYDEIPPFRRRAFALDFNNDTAAAIVASALVRRRALDEDEDEDMDKDTAPRKKAKRSNDSDDENGNGVGGNGGDTDMMEY